MLTSSWSQYNIQLLSELIDVLTFGIGKLFGSKYCYYSLNNSAFYSLCHCEV